MVKGVVRRVVVVVKPPDGKLFEQAIFLLGEEAAEAPEDQVLRQAQAVADDYLLRSSPQTRRRPGWLLAGMALLGAALASLVWFLVFPLPF